MKTKHRFLLCRVVYAKQTLCCFIRNVKHNGGAKLIVHAVIGIVIIIIIVIIASFIELLFKPKNQNSLSNYKILLLAMIIIVTIKQI